MFRTVLLTFSLITAFIMQSCTPVTWVAPFEKKAEILLPPLPNPTKASYLGHFDGFQQEGKSLFDLLTGKSHTGNIVKPVAIALGQDERIAIADTAKQGVHLYIPATKKYQFINEAETMRIMSPVSVIFDDSLNLYVSDSFHKQIFIYNANGKLTRKITGFGSDPFGKASNAPFGRPTGLAYHQLNSQIYLTDTGTNQIHIFNDQGEYQTSFGNRGTSQNEFNFPTHIAATDRGKIIVNDALNFRVQLFDHKGEFLSSFGNHGDGSGDFSMPKGVAVDRWGIIYVVDALFDTVQLFDTRGNFLLALGSRGTDPGEFWLPSGIFIDHNDKLYICDTYNQRIQMFQLYKGATDGGAQ